MQEKKVGFILDCLLYKVLTPLLACRGHFDFRFRDGQQTFCLGLAMLGWADLFVFKLSSTNPSLISVGAGIIPFVSLLQF